MTTKTCALYKAIDEVWMHEQGLVHLVYDFANDTGAATHTAYYLGRFVGKGLILDSQVYVETAVTSTAGACKMKIGTTTRADCILNKAWGSETDLVAGAVLQGGGGAGNLVAADDYVILVISGEAALTGKVHVFLRFVSM